MCVYGYYIHDQLSTLKLSVWSKYLYNNVMKVWIYARLEKKQLQYYEILYHLVQYSQLVCSIKCFVAIIQCGGGLLLLCHLRSPKRIKRRL